MKKLLYMLTTTVNSSIFNVTCVCHTHAESYFVSAILFLDQIEYVFEYECTHMLPTYGEESEDNHTCAHHVGIGILEGKMIVICVVFEFT